MSNLSKLDLLVQAHPVLLRELTPFRFSLPDGWIPIFSKMCQRIEAHCESEGKEPIKIIAAKEKFAEMRVYFSGRFDEKIANIFCQSTEISRTTCQVCSGKSEIRVINGWMYGLCKIHIESIYAQQSTNTPLMADLVYLN